MTPGLEIKSFLTIKPMLWGSFSMHCQAQRFLVKYAKHLRQTAVFYIIDPCQSSKSVQRYSTCCIILWKNHVFSRRRLGTLAYIDLGVFGAPFWKVWASKSAALRCSARRVKSHCIFAFRTNCFYFLRGGQDLPKWYSKSRMFGTFFALGRLFFALGRFLSASCTF